MKCAILLIATLATTSLAQPAAQPPAKPATLSVGIIVHEGVELLDFAGPCEAFGQTSCKVFTVAPTKKALRTNGGPVTVTPDYSIADVPRIDILVIPGGDTNILTADASMMAWIKKTTIDSKVTMSVCTGAFALAKAGLLDGKKATTYHGAIASLKRDYPKITVVENTRYVDNGQIITTEGVSAGIDGALYVISRELGEQQAWQAARGMQYNWEPAASATTESRESRDAAKAFAFRDWPAAIKAYSAILAKDPANTDAAFFLGLAQVNSGDPDKGIVNVERAIKAGRTDTSSMVAYARSLLVAQRYPDSIAAYEKVLAAGHKDHGTSAYNLACAYALHGNKTAALVALEKAIDEGFSNVKLMESDEDLAGIRTDDKFKALAKRIAKSG